MLDDLKAAMAAETAHLAVAPDLAERVERRAARKRWRTLLASLLVPLLAAVGWWLVPQVAGMSAVPADQVIDGVEVGYLPPGLTRVPVERETEDGYTSITGLWTTGGGKPFVDGGDGVAVSVYRGPRIENTRAWLESFGNGETREIAGHEGVYSTGMGVDTFFWVPKPGMNVMINTVGVDLERVVAGITVR
ncbi:hypothetical protein [Herbidospora cretacea]|uniref:hypothetical protein n=1 Tax=Herbidospora cretacea TaxID=28444 RepID=UPI0007743BCA|nr:hypothetical protein [Herbidospora cretacea]